MPKYGCNKCGGKEQNTYKKAIPSQFDIKAQPFEAKFSHQAGPRKAFIHSHSFFFCFLRGVGRQGARGWTALPQAK